MDINDIKKILPHRYPFLLIDRIIEFEPDISAHAIKCVTINEPFFQGHFQQAHARCSCSWSNRTSSLFYCCDEIKRYYENLVFHLWLLINVNLENQLSQDVLNLKVNRINKVKNVYKFEGKCLVNDVIHAQCIFSAMIHDVPDSSK